jgi:hypothetical protein
MGNNFYGETTQQCHEPLRRGSMGIAWGCGEAACSIARFVVH